MGCLAMQLRYQAHFFYKVFIVPEFLVVHTNSHWNSLLKQGENRGNAVAHPQVAAPVMGNGGLAPGYEPDILLANPDAVTAGKPRTANTQIVQMSHK